MTDLYVEKIEILPSALRYFKSLKANQVLLNKYKPMMKELQKNPYKGRENKGDLAGVFTIDFRHEKIVYELAYLIEDHNDSSTLIIVLAGTRENFYKELKRYIKESVTRKQK